ncbi:Cobalt-zinc-cadmium resistance protein [Mucinivorans hirudinis]|uniref:Cobalt-zinc-cadmium resistance protein n=1 Tax=Mucinivorans hirudinis TaxID=1433126 RepID=A0A060RE00_9BACT|nr:Cobalt-zinc-cadmium resistance protein [Mucinivorans hirudinis]
MQQREREIYKVTIVGSVVNVVLSVGKLAAGIVGRSGAMVADAVHSMSDFVTDVIVLIFVKLSSKPKDKNHDYGHGKYETLAGVIISLILIGVGVGILVDNFWVIRNVWYGEQIPEPGMIALWAAVVSIGAKEALYWYTVFVGRRVNSPVVIANAWHHRTDAFSSLATLAGIGGAIFLGEHYRILDPVAAVIVSFMIMKVGWNLLKPGIDELLERSLSLEMEDEIVGVILAQGDISDPHNLKTRRIGANIAIEIHLRIDGNMTVTISHELSHKIIRALKEKYGKDTQVIIHFEPRK